MIRYFCMFVMVYDLYYAVTTGAGGVTGEFISGFFPKVEL